MWIKTNDGKMSINVEQAQYIELDGNTINFEFTCYPYGKESFASDKDAEEVYNKIINSLGAKFLNEI